MMIQLIRTPMWNGLAAKKFMTLKVSYFYGNVFKIFENFIIFNRPNFLADEIYKRRKFFINEKFFKIFH